MLSHYHTHGTPIGDAVQPRTTLPSPTVVASAGEPSLPLIAVPTPVALNCHAESNIKSIAELDSSIVCKFPLPSNKLVNVILATDPSEAHLLDFWLEGQASMPEPSLSLAQYSYMFAFGTGDWVKDEVTGLPFVFANDEQIVTVVSNDKSRLTAALCQQILDLFKSGKSAELAYHDLEPTLGSDGVAQPHRYSPKARVAVSFKPHDIDVAERRGSGSDIVQAEAGALYRGRFAQLPSSGAIVYECAWATSSSSASGSKLTLRPKVPKFLLAKPVVVLKGKCVRLT